MPERQCGTCTAAQKLQWGCEASFTLDEDGDRVWANPAHTPIGIAGEEEWWACPRQDMHRNPRQWNRMLLFYGMYKKGFLPDEGSVSSQSNFAIEVFRVFDNANAEADEYEAAEARRKAARA